MEKHYTLSKAAELLGVTTQTLRNWDNSGKIKTIRTPGNQRRIPESEIFRFINPDVVSPAKAPSPPETDTVAPVKVQAPPQTDTDTPAKTPPPQADTDNVETSIAEDKAPSPPVEKSTDTAEFPTVTVKNQSIELLMCKNIPVYDITNKKVLNENLVPGCILRETMDYSQWAKTRHSSETNFSARRLMQSAFDKYDFQHATQETKGLSLSDCFWVKQQDEDILFEDITPYQNPEWNGEGTYTGGSISTLFTAGTKDKRWLNPQTLLKTNSFKELQAYKFCDALGLYRVSEAKTSNEGLLVTNFTSQDFYLETMAQSGFVTEDINHKEVAVEKFNEMAVALFVVDYLIENNDRHFGNYGFLKSTTDGFSIMAPFYDFDRIWSGEVTPLPMNAWQGYRDYINTLCKWAIANIENFEYGSIIERRAHELLGL